MGEQRQLEWKIGTGSDSTGHVVQILGDGAARVAQLHGDEVSAEDALRDYLSGMEGDEDEREVQVSEWRNGSCVPGSLATIRARRSQRPPPNTEQQEAQQQANPFAVTMPAPTPR